MKKNLDQLSLFNRQSLNIVSRLKAAMRESLRCCGPSREQIAEQMTEAILVEGLKFPGNSRSISKAILDKWVSESSPHVIPLSFLPLFCVITRDFLPIHILLMPLGLKPVGKRESKLLEWAEKEIKRRHISREIKRLEEEIGI